MKNHRYIQGFTLLELMITLAIVIIMTTIGLPSFFGLIRDSNMTATANDMLSAINYARSEAVTRNMDVVIQSKSGIAGDWSAGWDIFTDFNGNRVLDASVAEEQILKKHDALPNGYTLIANATNMDSQIIYLPSGLRDSIIGGTLFLCKDNDASTARAIIINNVGRARVDTANACS